MVTPDQERQMLADAIGVYARVFQDEQLSSSRVQAALVAMKAARDELRRQENEIIAKDLGDLTSRQMDVLSRLAELKTYDQIALELQVKPHTVRTHLSDILKKLDLVDRSQAVIVYLRRRDALYPSE